ncbi:fumarylacetoacetate hydrolase family protein [Microbacterium sp. zg-YB36]|uniref:fumarylacetoacetate hydrolase family protein n=1 Tax=Microbacterium sp. zg-YB36 TaxID=2969407 RepID=UPI00214AEF4D|nr:fumarylacetoacetate hydrolase family protein [Microbacterium sp. zg-YB36]MDL5351229.1 fumarylacetoacetate hydrolase family protein [Microbacterium sp. zg-YB36]
MPSTSPSRATVASDRIPWTCLRRGRTSLPGRAPPLCRQRAVRRDRPARAGAAARAGVHAHDEPPRRRSAARHEHPGRAHRADEVPLVTDRPVRGRVARRADGGLRDRGRGGRRPWRSGHPADEAWDHVAGVCVGQDLSDRDRMLHASVPQQFSMAKSFAGAGPFGPYLVTPDEFDDPDDIPYSATLEGPGVDGVLTVQAASTGELVYGVPEVIARLSETVELLPGDLIFMGTPGGIGLARGQLLRPGVVLTSILDDVARMRTTFSSQLDPFPVPPPPPGAPAGPPPR